MAQWPGPSFSSSPVSHRVHPVVPVHVQRWSWTRWRAPSARTRLACAATTRPGTARASRALRWASPSSTRSSARSRTHLEVRIAPFFWPWNLLAHYIINFRSYWLLKSDHWSMQFCLYCICIWRRDSEPLYLRVVLYTRVDPLLVY